MITKSTAFKITFTLFFLITVNGLGTSVINAGFYDDVANLAEFETKDYQELAPLPETRPSDSQQSTGPIKYLENLYYFVLTISVILAVVMIIIAGIEYTAYGMSEEIKSDAKKRITYAIAGLLLALVSWLLLYIINPKLVEGDLLLPSAKITDVGRTGPSAGGGGAGTSTGPRPAGYREAELALRAELQSKGVGVSGSICSTYQQTSCTSLTDVPRSAIDRIIALKNTCGCDVTITGGAEAGHKTHGPGKPVLDLSQTNTLTKYLTNNNTVPLSCGAVYKSEYRYETSACVDVTATHYHFVLGGVNPI